MPARPAKSSSSMPRADASRRPGRRPGPRDGKPDLSGVWYPGPDLEPEVPPMLPWAEELFKKRSAKSATTRAPSACLRASSARTAWTSPSWCRRRRCWSCWSRAACPGRAPGVPRRAPASAGRAAVVARPLGRPLGGRHAGDRHDRAQRSGVAGPGGAAADREGAHRRALSAARPRAPGGRDHDRRPRCLLRARGRSGASSISPQARRSSSTSATRITRRSTSLTEGLQAPGYGLRGPAAQTRLRSVQSPSLEAPTEARV